MNARSKDSKLDKALACLPAVDNVVEVEVVEVVGTALVDVTRVVVSDAAEVDESFVVVAVVEDGLDVVVVVET